MTDEELDRALVAEARRIADNPNDAEEVAMLVLDLKRRGWTPPEPVDRWTMEVREFLKAQHPGAAPRIDEGMWDGGSLFAAARASLQRGYEIGKAEADPVGVKVREIVEGFERDGKPSPREYMARIRALIQAEKEAGK